MERKIYLSQYHYSSKRNVLGPRQYLCIYIVLTRSFCGLFLFRCVLLGASISAKVQNELTRNVSINVMINRKSNNI